MVEIGRKDWTDSPIPLIEDQQCACTCAVSYDSGKRIEQAVSIVQFYAAKHFWPLRSLPYVTRKKNLPLLNKHDMNFYSTSSYFIGKKRELWTLCNCVKDDRQVVLSGLWPVQTDFSLLSHHHTGLHPINKPIYRPPARANTPIFPVARQADHLLRIETHYLVHPRMSWLMWVKNRAIRLQIAKIMTRWLQSLTFTYMVHRGVSLTSLTSIWR